VPEKIARFEDLVAWQRARELHFQLQREFERGPLKRTLPIGDQLERAASSAMANIAEGYERSGAREFAHGLSVAKGSAAEVRSHLYAALDAGLLAPARFEELRALADETSKVIAGLRAAVMRSVQK
jgi:four helix bundle protein